MTTLNDRQVKFPVHPSDGFQIKEELSDGGYAVWTYNAAYNEWTCEVCAKTCKEFVTSRQVLMTETTQVTTADGQTEVLQTQEQFNNVALDAAEKATKAATETEALRQRVEELQAQLSALSARLP